jgi:hypothetical protein
MTVDRIHVLVEEPSMESMLPARNRSRSFQRLQAVFLEVLGEA